jgi:hypothetical protein
MVSTITRPSTSIEWFHETGQNSDLTQVKYKDTLKMSTVDSQDGLTRTITIEFSTKDGFVDWFFDESLSLFRLQAQAYNNQHGIIQSILDRSIY